MGFEQKINKINETLAGHKVLVALSGGVDSSLMAKLAYDTLGADNVLAVTVDSETTSSQEVLMAQHVTAALGIQHEVLTFSDLENTAFAANPIDRCYHCKHHLYKTLLDMAKQRGYSLVIDGTNASDDGDYRPGVQALKELGIVSPLKESNLTKAEIREMARTLALPNWDRPANACLASRFPYGVPITAIDLLRVDEGEALVRSLGVKICRLRHHGNMARIEVDASEVSRLLVGENRARLVEGIKALGYTYVTLDLEGYRMGSLNEELVVNSWHIADC